MWLFRRQGSQAQGAASTTSNEARKQKLLDMYQGWKPRFPSVQTMDVQQLASLIEDDTKQEGPPKVVLVDARTVEELEVSVIPSRCTLSPQQFEQRHDEFCQRDVTVVVYCTAGLRSGLYASKLLDRGFKPDRVFNLEGSILGWSLHGLPVARKTSEEGTADVQTKQVHTYNADWAQYLASDYEAVTTMSLSSKFKSILG